MGLREKLQEVFREVFDDDSLEIYEEMTAEDVEDWDSLTNIQLILTVEETFHVKFSTEDILKLDNVGEFLALLEKKKGEV